MPGGCLDDQLRTRTPVARKTVFPHPQKLKGQRKIFQFFRSFTIFACGFLCCQTKNCVVLKNYLTIRWETQLQIFVDKSSLVDKSTKEATISSTILDALTTVKSALSDFFKRSKNPRAAIKPMALIKSLSSSNFAALTDALRSCSDMGFKNCNNSLHRAHKNTTAFNQVLKRVGTGD